MSKKTKPVSHYLGVASKGKAHAIKKGKCALCKRTGGDLQQPCPGYVTAGELVDWTQPLPMARAVTSAVKQTRKQRKEARA